MNKPVAKNVQILIVDDQPSAHELLKGLLSPEGYDLAFTASGPDALARLDELTPDVILLDVMMPGMNGFELCRHIKADKRWQHIPIILVTALNGKADLARGLEAGADDFLPKPVNGLELRARVRSMLRIKKQHDELEKQNQELVATLQLREDLARMIVHDMRTPLAAIFGFSELLLIQNNLPPQSMKRVQLIHNQAHRLNAFLNDMLMLAKMEQGQLILSRSPVDVNRLVQELKQNHEVIAQSKRINLAIDLMEESRPISLDVNLFYRVLDNLLSNALKFSPAESTVSVQVEYPDLKSKAPSAGARLRIKIIDEGPGIAPEHRERIFDKFEIVTLKQEGVLQVGLGLTFTRLVIEAHDGKIYVEANRPRGSVFVIEM